MKKLKVVLFVVVGVAFLVTVALASVNPLAHGYVLSKYPEVTHIDSLRVRWDWSVDCRGVVVERPGLKATFDHVHVSPDKKITITGGKVDVTLTGRSTSTPGTGAEGLRIEAFGLRASVRRGDVTFTSPSVNVTETNVTFAEGYLRHPRLAVALTNGSYDRASKTFQVGRASTSLDAKEFDVPEKWRRLAGLMPPQPVVAEGVKAVLYPLDEALSPKTRRTLVEAETIAVGETLSDPNTRIGPMWRLNEVKIDVVDNGNPETSGYEMYAHSVLTNHALFRTRWTDSAGIGSTAADLMHVKVLVPGRWQERGLSFQIGLDEEQPIAARAHGYRLDATSSCQGWMTHLPGPVVGDLTTVDDLLDSISGNLTVMVTTHPKPQLKIEQDCKIKCDSDLITRLKKPFKQTVYKPNGVDRYVRHTGPGAGGWTPLGLLPPHVPDAFVALEDPGFPHHKGVHLLALNNSLEQNVEAKHILRGGSTITMQLVRNLWLSRHQTVQRKGREIILAWMLEGCLSKREILELYLNAIEFGPDTYGIGAGSQKWFDSGPGNLTLEEAFYLAHILPAPTKAVHPDHGGMAATERLMQAMVVTGTMPEHLQMLMVSAGMGDL